MEGKKCPSCGSGAVDFDDSNPLQQYVCISCGTIVEECVSLTNEHNGGGTSYIYSFGGNCPPGVEDPLKRYKCYSVPPGKKEGLEKITQLASIFSLSREMKACANSLFCNAYMYLFKNDRIAKKMILAACCVYMVLRQYNRPVVYRDLCLHSGCKPKQFFAVYRLFEKFRGTKVLHQTTEDIVRVVLRDMKIDNKEKFIKKTVEIVDVCSEAGRSRTHIVIAAAYIAWVSSDYSHHGVKFSKFFSMFPFPKDMLRTASARVHDLCAVLIKHAEKLPWLKDGSVVDNRKVFLYVDAVLKHFRSLHDVVAAEERNNSDSDNMDVLERETFHPEIMKRDIDWAHETDFYDEDISDTEIEKYIRTESEITEFCKFRDAIRAVRSDIIQCPEQTADTSVSCNDEEISDSEHGDSSC